MPAYVAVMECVPTASEGTLICAELLDREADPRVVEPSMNVTVPVAVIPDGGCTVAVKVTACPKLDGFSPELRAVVVEA